MQVKTAVVAELSRMFMGLRHHFKPYKVAEGDFLVLLCELKKRGEKKVPMSALHFPEKHFFPAVASRMSKKNSTLVWKRTPAN